MADLAGFVDFLQDSGLVIRSEDMFSGKHLALVIINPKEKQEVGRLIYPKGIIGPYDFESMTHGFSNEPGFSYELLKSIPEFTENKVTYSFGKKEDYDEGWNVEVYDFGRNLPRDRNYEKLDLGDHLANRNPFPRGSGLVPSSCSGEQDLS